MYKVAFARLVHTLSFYFFFMKGAIVPIMIIKSPRNVLLNDAEEEIIKKGLRLLVLVADIEDGLVASKILAVLSQEKHGV